MNDDPNKAKAMSALIRWLAEQLLDDLAAEEAGTKPAPEDVPEDDLHHE
jgi:hypothetical protein